jgi:hypothetical protein
VIRGPIRWDETIMGGFEIMSREYLRGSHGSTVSDHNALHAGSQDKTDMELNFENDNEDVRYLPT